MAKQVRDEFMEKLVEKGLILVVIVGYWKLYKYSVTLFWFFVIPLAVLLLMYFRRLYLFSKKLDSSIKYIERAQAKFGFKKYHGAISDYSKAIELNPKDEKAYYNRGFIKCANLNYFEVAILDFNKAIELNPNFYKAYLNRGIAKQCLNDYEGALADFEKADNLVLLGGVLNPNNTL